MSLTGALTIQRSSPLSLSMGLKLYGSPSTRSPLVNWYLLEKNIPFTQMPPRPNPNPFGQVPCITDDGGVEVFESGAVLLYVADKYGGNNTPEKRASYTKVLPLSAYFPNYTCFQSQFLIGSSFLVGSLGQCGTR